MCLWNYSERLRCSLRRATATEPSLTTTLRVSSDALRNFARLWPTSKKPWRLNITTCTSVATRLKNVYRYRIHATSTWISARSSVRWASMSWPCSIRWKPSFWFKTSSFRSSRLLVTSTQPKDPTSVVNRTQPPSHSNSANPKTGWSSCALPTTISRSSRNSSSNTRQLWTVMLRPPSLPQSILGRDTQWRRIWTRSLHRLLRKLPQLSRRPWWEVRCNNHASASPCRNWNRWFARVISNDISLVF